MNPNFDPKVGEATRFKPGQSGNPNGRPRKLPKLDEILADVLGEERDGITAAQQIVMRLRKMATDGNIRAAEVLLNRGYGAVKENATLDDLDGVKLIIKRAPKPQPPEQLPEQLSEPGEQA